MLKAKSMEDKGIFKRTVQMASRFNAAVNATDIKFITAIGVGTGLLAGGLFLGRFGILESDAEVVERCKAELIAENMLQVDDAERVDARDNGDIYVVVDKEYEAVVTPAEIEGCVGEAAEVREKLVDMPFDLKVAGSVLLAFGVVGAVRQRRKAIVVKADVDDGPSADI